MPPPERGRPGADSVGDLENVAKPHPHGAVRGAPLSTWAALTESAPQLNILGYFSRFAFFFFLIRTCQLLIVIKRDLICIMRDLVP